MPEVIIAKDIKSILDNLCSDNSIIVYIEYSPELKSKLNFVQVCGKLESIENWPNYYALRTLNDNLVTARFHIDRVKKIERYRKQCLINID